MNTNHFFKLTFVTALTLLISACGGGGGGGGSGPTPPPPVVNPAGSLVDQAGDPISAVGTTDSVNVKLSGLQANTQYFLVVTDPNGDELSPTDGFIATTDEEGNLPDSTVLADLEAPPTGALSMSMVSQAVGTGNYNIAVRNANGDIVFNLPFTVNDVSRVSCADSTGLGRASFTTSEAVYAKLIKGGGTLDDGTYTCHVLSDLNAVLEDGDRIVGVRSAQVTVASGEGLVNLNSFALGPYDVVCDINGDGQYTAGTDLLSRARRFDACFTVQNAHSGNHIVGQICSDANGNYRDIFDPNSTDRSIRDVWAWITPVERSLVDHRTGVDKYVVPHQANWTDGDPLLDVTGGNGTAAFDRDPVRAYCTNERPWLIWPRQLLVSGCYDCIVDVNANGQYDQGVDFVDNIDNSGDNATCGMRVSDANCGDFITVTSHASGTEVNSTAVTLAGTFAEAPSSGTIIITAGSQSNSVNIPGGSDNFSVNVPLFSGVNLLTISAINNDNTTCSETMSLRSTSTLSDNQLFRVQLNWDGDTDMDLHLVRPGGAYKNSADDCNYSNCDVGIDGSGTEYMEWGEAGNDDDPRLDIDCVSCGNGIENIWMNAIGQDGRYTIYVDAWSGTESPVNATVFIRGVNVGTVACGELSSGTGTDTCRVGYIDWQGGSAGNGNFTPDGSKASTF